MKKPVRKSDLSSEFVYEAITNVYMGVAYNPSPGDLQHITSGRHYPSPQAALIALAKLIPGHEWVVTKPNTGAADKTYGYENPTVEGQQIVYANKYVLDDELGGARTDYPYPWPAAPHIPGEQIAVTVKAWPKPTIRPASLLPMKIRPKLKNAVGIDTRVFIGQNEYANRENAPKYGFGVRGILTKAQALTFMAARIPYHEWILRRVSDGQVIKRFGFEHGGVRAGKIVYLNKYVITVQDGNARVNDAYPWPTAGTPGENIPLSIIHYKMYDPTPIQRATPDARPAEDLISVPKIVHYGDMDWGVIYADGSQPNVYHTARDKMHCNHTTVAGQMTGTITDSRFLTTGATTVVEYNDWPNMPWDQQYWVIGMPPYLTRPTTMTEKWLKFTGTANLSVSPPTLVPAGVAGWSTMGFETILAADLA